MTTTRSHWPAAKHLHQAADEMHRPDTNLDAEREYYTASLGEWLEQTALDMAWLAPFREHEGGYRPWRVATRMAHGILGLPDPDTCPVCHPPRRGTEVTSS